jgi:addiction module RelB/DinJ family antitoxin
MPKEEYVRARTSTQLKQHAEAILSRLGLNMTDAINMFLVQVTMHDGLPFEVKIAPNDEQYRQTKGALLEDWKRNLNSAIEAAEQDVAASRILTMEEAKARTRKAIESVRRDSSLE